MTASSNQQPMFTPATLYAKTPKTMGAAVVKAMILKGLFDNPGKKYQRSELLDVAQDCHCAANDGLTFPEHETLGRELRSRKGKRQQAADRLFGIGWCVCADDGRLWVEKVK
jgi:hypothetical protein